MTRSRLFLLASASAIALSAAAPASAQNSWATLEFGAAREQVSLYGSDYDVLSNMRALGFEAGTRLPILNGWSVSLGMRDTKRSTGNESDVGSSEAMYLPFMGCYSEGCSYSYYYGILDGDFEEYAAELQTVDLEVGRDIALGSGSRVTFGLRRANLRHAIRASSYYYNYPALLGSPPSTGDYYDAETDLQGTGVRVAAEINFPVAPKVTIETEVGASIMKYTGTQITRTWFDGSLEDSGSFEFWKDENMRILDATLGVAYQVAPNIKVKGGVRMDRVTVSTPDYCDGPCDMTFDFRGAFANVTMEF